MWSELAEKLGDLETNVSSAIKSSISSLGSLLKKNAYEKTGDKLWLIARQSKKMTEDDVKKFSAAMNWKKDI
ncbi:MAG: hypothetical protein ACD_2C00181G0012 [uncultured bacterium (gcode 4)]|uniref:Uncharacterized protein n=1 Tax=uncultured bacterium (gcode 4) TaxID=1234023 RepID=K2GG77_9BACT|nr:MAG: hypothetical protein ACD_2C00181G0012 [uncultured bacterium (gcode 4)]